MAFAILRTAKLTGMGNIGGSAQHNFRERETLNADPARTRLNATTGAQSAKEVVAAVKARLKTVPTVRKNAVLAVEYFIGASPEWFAENSHMTQDAYFDAAEKWLKERHGGENVIAFTRQYDETSPHVCAYVVPIDPKGKLNCSHFLDGREKLSQMQTDFAEKVGRPFHLARGIEGSQATHQTIKQYYAKIQAPTPEIKTQIPDVPPATVVDKLAAAAGLPSQHSRAVERQAEARKKRAAELRAQRVAEQAKAKQYEAEKAANKAREARLAELRATATQARDLPLESVLARLGCRPDPKDKNNWRTPAGRVTVDGLKFYAHDQGRGGGGAIDLVMLIEDTDYQGALTRLVQDFGSGATLAQAVANLKPALAAAEKKKQPYKAPAPKPQTWARVRQYLVDKRRLSADVVDRLHDLGKVYSDKYSNAVFVLGAGTQGVGVELRGTGEQPFHGVRGEKAPFFLDAASASASRQVAFVESAIDAISLYELGFQGRIMSLGGNSAEVASGAATAYRAKGWTVVAAFDNDRAGDQMAAGLGQPTERLRPTAKDWNDDLKLLRLTAQEREQQADREQEQEARKTTSTPGLR